MITNMDGLIQLCVILSTKEILTAEEEGVYRDGLRFIGNQCELANHVIERGIDELRKPEKGGYKSDFDIKSYRSAN